ncbi:MAG: hypothetical protein HYU88_00625 [Chloroflexi bacterium]|nr:hypothetical protein [Chloroflexota bacterium]MBI4503959.1 hypothetical protein [Chloroflexota bacterium]
MIEHGGQPEDLFYCDFCGAEVGGDQVEFRLDVNDIYVFCPRCLQRAREMEQSLGPGGAGPLGAEPEADLPPELLDE